MVPNLSRDKSAKGWLLIGTNIFWWDIVFFIRRLIFNQAAVGKDAGNPAHTKMPAKDWKQKR
ncbi:hypothetical protein ES707_15109 [subsurface metagenome]